jgi:transposase
MSQEIKADYKQIMIFPPCVEDWVPANHPARFIREIVEAMNLEELGFKKSEGEEGRPHYATEMLLEVWLYGYYSKIRSTRGLEKACMENVALIWLTGNNTPDHNTLWRFFRDNKKAIRKVFKQSVRVALDASLVGMVVHALDGTKIRAAASNRTALSKKALDAELKKLDEQIEEIEAQVEAGHGKEGGQGWALPDELRDAAVLRDAVQAGLAALKNEGAGNISVDDPDARVMKTPEGNRFAYNAQAVADEASGLIVGIDVVNEENDWRQLTPMLERATDTLDGRVAQENLADAGYACGEQIAAARDAGYEIMLPMEAEKAEEFHVINFEHDVQRDVVVCPMGRTLEFEREKESRTGNCTLRIYRCRHGEYCERAAECTKDKQGRMVGIAPWHAHIRAQREKQRDKEKRRLRKRRGAIIEIVFAGIKENFGFRRFTVRGLENVKTQWSLVCTAFNLRKLYRTWISGNLKIALRAV